MKVKRIALVLVLFFLVGATAGIPYGFLTKWGVESAYAKDNKDNKKPKESKKHVQVPEPSTMLLLGSGLIGIWALSRKFKN